METLALEGPKPAPDCFTVLQAVTFS